MSEKVVLHAERTPVHGKPLGTYDGIQALRFFAALLVVVTHSFFYASERLVPGIGQWSYGGVGVDVFFVISGFVMVVSTAKRVDHPDVWKFYAVRRLVRIVPMYWIATTVKLLIMLVLPGAALHASLSTGHVISSYFFIPTRNVDGRVEPLLGVGWTLTFEMFFYLVFGLSLLLMARKAIWLASGVMAALAVCSLFRPGTWPTWAYYFDDIVLYFVVGMWIARIARLSIRKLLLGLVCVACFTIFAVDFVVQGFDFSPGSVQRFTLVCTLVSAVVALEPLLSGRVPRPIMFFGDASYTLYLFHPIVAPVVPVLLGIVGLRIGWLSVLGSICAALTAAAVIYVFVEKPLTKRLRGLSRYA